MTYLMRISKIAASCASLHKREDDNGNHISASLVETLQKWRGSRSFEDGFDERVNTAAGVHSCYTSINDEMSMWSCSVELHHIN